MDDYHVTLTPDEVAAARVRAGREVDWEAIDQQTIPTTPVVVAAFALEFAAVFGMAASVLLVLPVRRRFLGGPDYRLRGLGITSAVIAAIAYALAATAGIAQLHRGPQRRRWLARASGVLSHLVSAERMRRRLAARTPSGALADDPGRHLPLVLAGLALVSLEALLWLTGVVGPAVVTAIVPVALLVAMVRYEMVSVARTSGARQRVHRKSVYVTAKALRDTLMFAGGHLVTVVVLPNVFEAW
jgi:hypothetical protein